MATSIISIPNNVAGGAAEATTGTARIFSLDVKGMLVYLSLLSAESPEQRKSGALWDEVAVSQATRVPSEFRYGKPRERTYRFTLDAYTKGGLPGSVEAACKTLEDFSKRVDGKVRAHAVMFVYMSNQFGPAFVESCELPVWRHNPNGEALVVKDGTIMLKELGRA